MANPTCSVDRVVADVFKMPVDMDVLAECLTRAAIYTNVIPVAGVLKKIRFKDGDTVVHEHVINPTEDRHLVEHVGRVMNRHTHPDSHFTIASICMRRLALEMKLCEPAHRYELVFGWDETKDD